MIIWGGNAGVGKMATGGRYNPSTNTWTAMALPGEPSARDGHTAIWTGTEMIIWGGHDGTAEVSSGARYNPSSNTWTAVTATGAPAARTTHTAVWASGITPPQMIVWGGIAGATRLNSGSRYDPALNSWTAVSATAAPSARNDHTTVWTGNQMIVWGGDSGTGRFADGARYYPVDPDGTGPITADSWQAVQAAGSPVARSNHTAVFANGAMILWGGRDGPTNLNDGARYRPSTDAWTATSGTPQPVPGTRYDHVAVSRGTGWKMIVWGGVSGTNLQTGSRYSPLVSCTVTADCPTDQVCSAGTCQ
jgi:N-acetylneuraminic acid mutarotase